MRSAATMPGCGDACTWPAFAMLPGDPRAPDVAEELSDAMDVCDELRLWLSVADKAIARSDVAGFRAAMQTAQRYLSGMAF